MRLARVAFAISAIFTILAGGCISNPTPHPALDSGRGDDTQTADTSNVSPPTDERGCDDAGGFWTGSACDLEASGPDTLVDAFDPEAKDAIDGSDDDGIDVPDVGPDTASDG